MPADHRSVAALRALFSLAYPRPTHRCPRRKSACAFYSAGSKRCTFAQQYVDAVQVLTELEHELKLGKRGNPTMNTGEFTVNGTRYALNISASGVRKEITRAEEVRDNLIAPVVHWHIYVRDLPLEYTVELASAVVKGMDLVTTGHADRTAAMLFYGTSRTTPVKDTRDDRIASLQRELAEERAKRMALRDVIRDITRELRDG